CELAPSVNRLTTESEKRKLAGSGRDGGAGCSSSSSATGASALAVEAAGLAASSLAAATDSDSADCSASACRFSSDCCSADSSGAGGGDLRVISPNSLNSPEGPSPQPASGRAAKA